MPYMVRVVLVMVLPVVACGSGDNTTVPPVQTERPKDAAPKADRPSSTGMQPAAVDSGSPTNVDPVPPADAAPATMADAGATTDTAPATMTDSAPATMTDAGAAEASPPATDAAPGTGTPMEAKWSYTACDKKALMFPKIDKNNGVFPIGSCPPPDDLYRACGGNSKIKVMTAMAQSWETGFVHPPEYAIDEYIMTRWSSNKMVTSWIELDLGTEQSFRRIYLAWELAHGTDYDIVTSNDRTTWTTLKQVRGGDGFQDILDVEGKARYVRMNGIVRGKVGNEPLYGYSLFDFTICGERP
jgi:hypothetical protein